MLGWEFPPFVNGGLGVASLGLSKALAEYTDLTVIVPRADEDFMLEQASLIGLNQVTLNQIREQSEELYYEIISKAELAWVDANLKPYDSVGYWAKDWTEEIPELAEVFPETLGHRPFTGPAHESQEQYTERTDSENQIGKAFPSEGEIYGDDVMANVFNYSKMTTQIALEKHFDLIHAHDWMTFLAALELKSKTGKPLALHIHSLEYDRGGPYRKNWVYFLEKYAMEQADVIIPVSEYSAQVIEREYGISPRKIAPVHNGIEITEVERKEKPFPESLVVFLGRITAQKGPQYFVEMAKKVLAKEPNVRFVMAGHGDQLEDVAERVAESRMGDRFHLTGFLNTGKVQELLSMADVFVMPSVSEPFGLAAVEAAYAGIPCVISRQSGAVEVLPGALTADFWDTDKLASHVIKLLRDEAYRKEVAETTQEHLRVSWDETARKVLEAYKQLLSQL